jgi:arylsulfatase A-like enzyme
LGWFGVVPAVQDSFLSKIIFPTHRVRFQAFIVSIVLGIAGLGFSRSLLVYRNLNSVSRPLRRLSRVLSLPLLISSLAAALIGGVRVRADWAESRSDGLVGATRPNILFITFDALSASDMSLYGYRLQTTPFLDRFAHTGITFDRFYAASNWTTASIATILTSQNVPRHGVLTYEAGLPNSLRTETFVHILREAGYKTGAVVTNRFAHPVHLGIAEDFDFLPASPRLWVPSWPYHLSGTDFAFHFEAIQEDAMAALTRILPPPFQRTDFPPVATFREAKRFFEPKQRPYFLWVHLLVPHFAYLPEGGFNGTFLPTDEFTTRYDYNRVQASYDPNLPLPLGLQPTVEKWRLRYDEFIRYADSELESFLGDLESSGNLANTIIFISADHGESFEHRFWSHGGDELWNDVIHVPLVVRLPGNAMNGLRVNSVAGQVDILPTMLDIAGLRLPAWSEGRSLRNIWEQTDLSQLQRFSVTGTEDKGKAPGVRVVAVMDGDYKYILDIPKNTSHLFNLAEDPLEQKDIGAEKQDLSSSFREAALRAIAEKQH